MIYDQGGSTLSLFGDKNSERALFGWEVPTTIFQSLNPLFVVALAPVFAATWVALARRNREPSTIVKFSAA